MPIPRLPATNQTMNIENKVFRPKKGAMQMDLTTNALLKKESVVKYTMLSKILNRVSTNKNQITSTVHKRREKQGKGTIVSLHVFQY